MTARERANQLLFHLDADEAGNVIVFDGSTGLSSTVAGRKSEGSGV
jgi:hypothetical protein